MVNDLFHVLVGGNTDKENVTRNQTWGKRCMKLSIGLCRHTAPVCFFFDGLCLSDVRVVALFCSAAPLAGGSLVVLVFALLFFFFFVFHEPEVWDTAGGAVRDDAPPPPPSPPGLLDGSDAAAAVGVVDDEEEARRSLHSFLWPARHASNWQASLQ